MSTRLHAFLACVWVCTLALAPACQPKDPCDPGYRVEHGECYAIKKRAKPDAGTHKPSQGDDDAGTASTQTPADAATAAPADPFEGVGRNCAKASDCPASLTCGAPNLPMCLKTNCLGDPNGCPPDWMCIDVGAASPFPSITSVCLML